MPHLIFCNEDEQLFIDSYWHADRLFLNSFVLFLGYHTCKVYSIGFYGQLCQLLLKYMGEYCKVFHYFLRN